MADNSETLRFVLLGDDRASSTFSRFGRAIDETTGKLETQNLVLRGTADKIDEIRRKADELGRLNPKLKPEIDSTAFRLQLALLRRDIKDSLNQSGTQNGFFGNLLGGLKDILGTSGAAGGAGGSGLLGITATLPLIGTLGAPAIAALGVAAAVVAAALTPVAAALIPITAGFGGLAIIGKTQLSPVFTALGESGKKLQATLKGMTDQQRDLYRQAEPLKDQFGQLAKSVRPEIYKAFSDSLKIIKSLMPALKPLVEAAGKALDAFLQHLVNWLQSPQGQSFVNWLKTVGPKDIENFGRILWDVAHTVGDALHWIYDKGSYIDRFVTRWKDDWLVVKNVFKLIGDELVVFALRLVQGILTPFTHIPFIGHYFATARDAVHRELVTMVAQAKNAAAQIQTSFDAIHGRTVPLNVDLNLPSGITLNQSGGKTQRRAAGGLITGGTPGRDSVLAALMPGEVVVPTQMVRAGAVDHLRGRLPGFADGGIVGDQFRPPVGIYDRRLIQRATADEAVVAQYVGLHASLTQRFRDQLTKGLHGGYSGGPGAGAPAANAALAKRMFPGWATGINWADWNAVAMRESGWSQYASNPSSGAYGIPQALPYTKMPKAAWPPWAGGSANPAAQIAWMAAYMGQRYGGPVGAWQHEVNFGWYDRGGFLPPGVTVAYNGTGRPEPVGGGTTYNITVNAAVSNPAEVGRQVVTVIREFEKRSGSSWRR